MTDSEFIATVAKLVAGLQVPVSMGMPLGQAREPWGQLHNLLRSGWHEPEEYEIAFAKVLNPNVDVEKHRP